MELLKTLSQAWKVEELRKKILFTLMMLVVYRIGSNIPVPGINRTYLSQMFSGETGLLDLFDLFSGGSFSNFTIFALSITPYVTASIIVQLLTIALPYFERRKRRPQEDGDNHPIHDGCPGPDPGNRTDGGPLQERGR